MECPDCNKKMRVINKHWVDPLVKCECSPYMMRMSKAKEKKDVHHQKLQSVG
mgnify:CR=1 FL=1